MGPLGEKVLDLKKDKLLPLVKCVFITFWFRKQKVLSVLYCTSSFKNFEITLTTIFPVTWKCRHKVTLHSFFHMGPCS